VKRSRWYKSNKRNEHANIYTLTHTQHIYIQKRNFNLLENSQLSCLWVCVAIQMWRESLELFWQKIKWNKLQIVRFYQMINQPIVRRKSQKHIHITYLHIHTHSQTQADRGTFASRRKAVNWGHRTWKCKSISNVENPFHLPINGHLGFNRKVKHLMFFTEGILYGYYCFSRAACTTLDRGKLGKMLKASSIVLLC
jgi:hypothetical protein